MLLGVASMLATSPIAALADNQCGFQGCIAQVPTGRLVIDYAAQQMPEWCWAASLSMLFGYYGHPVPQASIVQRVYGAPINMPALLPAQISALINTGWTDQNGNGFQCQLVAAYDAFAGVVAINNNTIVDALSNDMPLIVCNTHHCMLLTALSYQMSPMGPIPGTPGFVDPWPGRGLRGPDDLGETRTTNVGGQLTYIGLATIT